MNHMPAKTRKKKSDYKPIPPRPPLGNKYALGHGCGAPEKYTDEWIEKESEAFIEWMKLPESIFFKSFAIERGYHPNRLQEFADKSPIFSGVLNKAKAWQEQKLINFALFNKINAGMTKFVLANHHGYVEKTQVSGDAANPLSFLLEKSSPSKDLVDDSGDQE